MRSAASFLALLFAAATVGACGSTAASPEMSGPPSAADEFDEPVVLSAPWMPPWTGAGSPPEIAERAATRFCGVEEGPEIDIAVRQCFMASVIAGRDIEFARLETTVEGDPIATVFAFEPPDSFLLLIDSSQDLWGHPGWQIFTCGRVVEDAAEVVRFDGCVQGPVFFE